MSSAGGIRERLPGLYRPQPSDPSLLNSFLEAVGGGLDGVDREAAAVLQAHWFRLADRSLYHPWVVRDRQLRGLAAQQPGDRVDLVDPAAFVARLAAAAAPGTDPVAEHLRTRLTAGTLTAVDTQAAETPVTPALQRDLLRDLNAIVAGESLFEPARFAAVELTPETAALATSAPSGGELVRLNRRLLAEAFPGVVAGARLDHGFVHDLGRLAALVPVTPWSEPPALRESVEALRLRVARTVELYRRGVGTRGALERVIEAQLPPAAELPPERRDRPFWIEEPAALAGRSRQVGGRGAPHELVGPLMTWSLDSEATVPTAPTLLIAGVEPVAGELEATDRPLVELYDDGGARPPLGLGFDGTVAAGEALRLRPAYAAWLGLETGLRLATSRPPEGEGEADPTAPGPWRAPTGAPPGTVTALYQAFDRTLWMGLDEGGTSALWRYDGRDWSAVAQNLAPIHCLAGDHARLLAGSEAGLLEVELFPAGGTHTASPVPGSNAPVFALLSEPAGEWLAGSADGLARLSSDGVFAIESFAGATAVAVRALARDPAGTLYLGTDLGLFQRQADGGAWYFYAGDSADDRDPDWRPLATDANGEPSELPAADAVFLPPVLAIHRGRDSSLWLGTANGIARYTARSVRGVTLETVLEAFPDLDPGPIAAIAEDERALVWFAGTRGPIGWDGRHWWQRLSDGLRHLGSADLFTPGRRERGTWRFHRGADVWQRFDPATGWLDETPAPRSAAGSATRALLWTDLVEADRGDWDGVTFTRTAGVSSERLRLRVKPSPLRIVDGGIAAVPRLPAGTSTWRYLSVETEPPVEAPRETPFWTTEGRLIPPPEDAPNAWPGRFSLPSPPPSSEFSRSVFAYCPAAAVRFSWRPRTRLSVLARLKLRDETEIIDPAIVDRVWQGIERVRPAGVRVALAVEDDIVRGDQDAITS